jgi:hypothetical protein
MSHETEAGLYGNGSGAGNWAARERQMNRKLGCTGPFAHRACKVSGPLTDDAANCRENKREDRINGRA